MHEAAPNKSHPAIEALLGDVARMGGLAEAMVIDALTAIVRRDTALAQSVIERDVRVDMAQNGLEKAATAAIAGRQPEPGELREALSAWKISIDLERVGDLAKNIAKRTLVLNQSEPIQLIKSVERMGKIAATHLKTVLDAYASRNIAPAVAVWNQDEDVDAHYNSLFRELLTYMMEDPRTIGPCAHLLFIAKNIERIGDHSTNIAEAVHILVTGEDIKRDRPKGEDARRTHEF